MRRASELPRRWRPRWSARAVLIGLGLVVIVVLVFGRAFAQFYLDALWHDGLGRGDVFWGQISAKATLFGLCFVLFLVLAGTNLYLADQAAPTLFPANVHPYVERFHDLFGHRLRIIRYATALVLGFLVATPAAAHWQEWLLYRNAIQFGRRDPQFNIDVGFYVFELPFLMFAVDWLFAAMGIVLVLTLAAHLLNGGVLFTSSMPTVRPATRVHLAALLAVLAAVKGADYWLTRYALTNESRGFVQGATYTVVNAQIPALMLLMLIALLTSVLFLWTIRSNEWRLPIVASALWAVVAIVGGLVYPAVIQRFVVVPSQQEREATYIQRNIDATLAAMGLDKVIEREVTFGSLTADEIEADLEPLRNVRLLNPTIMRDRFNIDEGDQSGMQIFDLDPDRVRTGDDVEQVLVAARELNLESAANPSWQGRHLINTHGCGLVSAPATRVNSEDRPDYSELELDRPELYFSPSLSGFAVVATTVNENACGSEAQRYEGTSGIRMGGAFRRAAAALTFLDLNVLASGAIESDSQLLTVRSVDQRVRKLAPFLDFDADPYPVPVDGRVLWVVDGYTSTAHYPYAQAIGSGKLSEGSNLSARANYVRNSVKATVDAYTGDVTFYAVDELDPILAVWRRTFPDLFTPRDEMPAELRDHLRYPEDLFRAQTELYSKYQVAPENFFSRDGFAWSVSPAPPTRSNVLTASNQEPVPTVGSGDQVFATESGSTRFVPYYTELRSPEGVDEFVILRPFVEFSVDDRRQDLRAYMTASSDPATYGRLISYSVAQSPLPPGPLRVANRAEVVSEISKVISDQTDPESGTQVRYGDVQLVPIGGGLLYVRPFYIETQSAELRPVELQAVIVTYNSTPVLAPTIDAALARLFPGFDAQIRDRVTDDAPDQSSPDSPPDAGDATALELMRQADELIADANEQLLRDGKLGEYQAKVDEAALLLARAVELLEAEGSEATSGG